MDSFPDPRTLTDQELVDLIDALSHEEQQTDYLGVVAQRKVTVLREELARRSGSADDAS